MAKYRKKPVIREAFQWNGGEVPGIVGYDSLVGHYYIMTVHRQATYIDPGDYIIKEPSGNGYYPCKPDIFEKEYDLIKDDSDCINPI